MVFKTILNRDILNIIFEFADITPKYDYYKREKLSLTGYKNLKMEYNCTACEKRIRNPKLHATYGFIINFYKYYSVDITNHCYSDSEISRFYHMKKTKPDNELYEVLRNVQGDVTEGVYNFIISMGNVVDDKILGKLIIDTIAYISNVINKFNKDRRRLHKCGIEIDVKMDSKEKILNKIKRSILDLNDIKIGYYCKSCSNNKKYYKFIKL